MVSEKYKWLKIILGVLILFNLALWVSGNIYLYKALYYNYVNIDDLDLFNNRTIKAGTPEPWAIGSDYNKIPLSDTLRNTLENYQSVAFLIIKDDSIRSEDYWDGHTQTALSNSFSVAKSVVSILVGIALHEGKIKDLDQPVCDYLSEFCTGDNSRLTIRHLLMMSSGLNWDESYTSLFGPTTKAYYGSDIRAQMLNLKVVTEPGTVLNYMSSNTQLLGFILEKATNQKLSDYASEKLWKPLGAESDGQWSLDHKDGNEKSYCCIYATARDFARIGKLMLQKGKWNDKVIISEKFVDESLSPAPVLDVGKPNTSYGYQWWLMEQEGKKIFYGRGILGQYIFVIPDMNLIFVRLGHERGVRDANGLLQDVPIYLSEVIKMYQ